MSDTKTDTSSTLTVHCGKAELKTARRAVRCQWGDCRRIEPGEVYVLMTTYPGHDSGYATYAGKPVRMASCADCCQWSVFDGKPLRSLLPPELRRERTYLPEPQ